MASPRDRARFLLARWASHPSRATAVSLRVFYGKRVLSLPLAVRADLCVALGEAAELEGRFETARRLFALAVGAIDPHADERTYSRAAGRLLFNAGCVGDRTALASVAQLVERLPAAQATSRLAGLGAIARGLERSLKGDWTAARRSFEAAMGASWESNDADAEALAHDLLARAWGRLGKLARAREHLEAGRAAAQRAGSRLLERRLALEELAVRFAGHATVEDVSRARDCVAEIQGLGHARLEASAWQALACGLSGDGARAEEILFRTGEPVSPRVSLKALRRAVARRAGRGSDPRLTRELSALVRLGKAGVRG